ncbi:hypothetical protein VUR80DRAFT_6783 [Thermomyces stellatus]
MVHLAEVPRGKECYFKGASEQDIEAGQNPKQPSGQYILVEAVQALDALRDLGWIVEFRWIPAHVRVPGNETADRVTKIAAGYDQETRTVLGAPPEPALLQTLMATTKTMIRRTMKSGWDLSWEKAKHGRDLIRLGARPGKQNPEKHGAALGT